jgi:hypothetical protein
MNDQLIASAATLEATLDRQPPAPVLEIRGLLGDITAEAREASSKAAAIASSPVLADLIARLGSRYAAIQAAVRPGTQASLTNRPAHVNAGRDAIAQIAPLTALNEELRSFLEP